MNPTRPRATRPLLFLASLLFPLALLSPASAQPSFIRGDCNGDVSVNISDPITMLSYLFQGGAVGCQKACDANDDGLVNLGDTIYLLAAIFSGGTPPPDPYPTCGQDPTSDALSCTTTPCAVIVLPSDNLREVDVAYLGIATADEGRLVSVTGSGAQHQLTSWSIASLNGLPSLLVKSAPINGHHARVERLSGLLSIAGEPPFVSAAIRADGNLWVSSRQLEMSGAFVHHGTVGYGSNANVEVLSYDIASRPIFSGFFLSSNQVVTAVVAEPIGGGPRSLRIVSWGIDGATGALTGLDDSGDLPVDFPQTLTPDQAAVSISHMNGIQYVLNFTNDDDRLENHFFWVENNGSIVYGGGDEGGQNIRGTAGVDIDQMASSVARVTNSGFITANRNLDGTLSMNVWERRDEGFLNYEPYQIADDSLDLGSAPGVFLATPQLNDSWRNQAREGDRLGRAVATGDFNGDGYADAVFAAPYRDFTADAVGAIYVIHGDASNGINDKEYTQVWTQNDPAIAGAPEDFDRFGEALAVGDFNGDGNDDLAIGVPYEDVGATSAGGAVNIIYGSPFGLTSSGDIILTQEDLGQTSAASDFFGFALASGDFDEDGRDDLAIGAYGREVGGHTNAGCVYVVWGAVGGLTTAGPTILHQDTTGIWDQVEDHDNFGRALAAGDFNGDGNSDLVIGVSREDIGAVVDAGAVHVLYGSSTTATGFGANNFISQGGFSGGEDIHGAVEANDYFGSSFAVGDFNDDGADDLAIGVPGEAVGALSDSGAINVLYGTIFGLTHINNLIISQNEFNPTGGSLPATAEANDLLGYALTAGDFDGDGYDDLMAGAPNKSIPAMCNASAVDSAGAVFEIFGGPSGLTSSGSKFIHQNACDAPNVANGSSQTGDDYGFSLAAGDFNADGEADLIVGIAMKDREDSIDTGAIHILPGAAGGVSYALDEEWYLRLRETVRGRVTDMTWESFGEGVGSLYSKGSFLDPIHVASVTKCMTLLLAVEAIEDGDVSLSDMVGISSLAGTTGGSFLEQWDSLGPVLDMGGNEIKFIQTGDTVRFEHLLHGMMMRSGNRCSVAIGEHVAEEVLGDPDLFVTMMNDRAVQLGMTDTVCGHPAGGMITTTQDLITLLMEGWEHPLFRQIAGTELYGDIAPAIQLCGLDAFGMSKCNSPFTKFQTIGNYPGRLGWKGGNGGLWWGSQPASGIPWCTASAVAVVERADREIAIALQQTGSRTNDAQTLLDYGFRKVFTPDHRASQDFPVTGGIVGPGGPIRVRAFALDTIESDVCVTAVIDDYEELRLNVWHTDYDGGDIFSMSSASETYALPDGTTYAEAPLTRIVRVPTSAAISDYVTANLDGEHLELQIWRVGQSPVAP
ncbi:MAG: FG-GAP repeat protein [Planctomycetes bacterium]|nr:FG-GAP repeat protein [Planctomycetota bacterium]